MLENPVRTTIAEGRTAFSGWLVEPSTVIAEALATESFDGITVDLQHGGVGIDDIIPMFQALSINAMPSFVRVPWNEPGVIARVLDAGALGIICPMVNTRAQCEAFIDAARYLPLGSRSYGPYRASLIYGPDYAQEANDAVVTLAMIETIEAVENLDEILSVPGLDGVFVGPSDLSQSMGLRAAPDWEGGPVLEAIERILKTVVTHGKIPGISTNSAAYAKRMSQLGFRFIAIPSEIQFLRLGARAALEHVRS